MNLDKFTVYLDSILADGLSKRKKIEIRDEFECHLKDKTDRFIEIGFDEETASEKAILEMGNPDEVRDKLFSLHKEKSYVICLMIIGLFLFMIYALYYGFMYVNLDTASAPFVYQVILSALYISFVVLLLYKNSMQRNSKTAYVLSGYFLIAAIIFWPFSAPTQPAFYSLAEVLNATVGLYFFKQVVFDPSFFVIFGSIIFNICCSLVSFITAKKAEKSPCFIIAPKRKSHLNLKAIVIALILFLIIMPSGYLLSNKSLGNKLELSISQKGKYFNEITAQSKELLDSLNFGMTIDEVDRITQNGNKNLIYNDKELIENDESGGVNIDYQFKHSKSEIYHNLDSIFIIIWFNKSGNLSSKQYHFICSDIYSRKNAEKFSGKLYNGMLSEEVMDLLGSEHFFPQSIYCWEENENAEETYSFSIFERNGFSNITNFNLDFKNSVLVKYYFEVLE